VATQQPAGPRAEGGVFTMPVDVDFDDALDHLSGMGNRFVGLVESIDDPNALAGGLDWTVAETAVHVWQALRYYASCLEGEVWIEGDRAPGEPVPAYVARENRRQIDAEPERDPTAIAAGVRQELARLIEVARAVGPGVTATYAAGYSEESTAAVCTLVCELIMHGHDIAQATGAEWDIDRSPAVVAAYSTAAALSLALDEDAAAGKDIHVQIRLRGGSPFSIRIRDGKVWSEITADSPDVRVSADPLAYLMVGFGRSGLLRPLLQGRIVAWGRKPWVMLQVPKMFLSL
jgi:uncharacterized protein (TIGR03083 family)